MSEFVAILILMLILIVFLSSSIKIAEESERFAIFNLGRFQAYKGPGLVIVAPFTQKAHRLRIGDIGLLQSADFARFAEIDIPIADAGSLKPGQAVRIDRFDGVEPKLVASETREKITCPGCGYQF